MPMVVVNSLLSKPTRTLLCKFSQHKEMETKVIAIIIPLKKKFKTKMEKKCTPRISKD
jgi:hypothetical protein